MREEDMLRFAQRLAVLQVLPVSVVGEKPSTDECVAAATLACIQ